MKITVLFGSHRLGGINGEIETMIKGLNVSHSFEFLHLADKKIESCTSCYQCAGGLCRLSETEPDSFEEILDKFINADVILIIAPVYAGVPSRLTALLERMTSLFFSTGIINTDNNPLLDKKTGIFNYRSNKICDDTHLKLLFQKFLMKNCSIDRVTYDYLNQSKDPDTEYSGIQEYVKQVILKLDPA